MSNITNKDIEYQIYTLSDINVIELLIRFRYKYDENMYLGYESTLMSVNGVSAINQEVVATYTSLNQLISQCDFSSVQIEMIRMVGEGYTYEEIAESLTTSRGNIVKKLKTIYKKIKNENDWQWRKVNYKDKLGLINKKCNKCKVELPATIEFFRARSDFKGDGFYNKCKKCEE